jgi:hypothetical protein
MTIEAIELESGEEGAEKGAGKGLVLIQEIGEFEIYRSAFSYSLKRKNVSTGSYFTTLGGCVKEISNIMRIEKLASRDPQLKRNIDSLISVLENHVEIERKMIADFDMSIVILQAKEKAIAEEKAKNKKEVS